MTGDDFIRHVKRAASVPTSQATFLTQDFLDLANLEMETYLFPFMNSLREEYFLHDMDYDYLQGGRYLIPRRATGGKVRDVKYVIGGKEYGLQRIPLDDVDDAVFGFYIRGNHIHIIPPTTDPTLIRLVYQAKPGSLTLLSSAAKVAGKSSSTIALESVPAGFASPIVFDIVHNGEPFEFYDEGMDREGTISGVTITITDGMGVPADLEIGDYITIAGTAPVVQYPSPVAALLVQRVAVKALEALGDAEGMSMSGSILVATEKEVRALFSNRAEGDSPIIVPDNPLFRG